MANEKKKNEKLLLEIVTYRQQFNKNGCDPLLAMENQNLKKKVKVDEQSLQVCKHFFLNSEFILQASEILSKTINNYD